MLALLARVARLLAVLITVAAGCVSSAPAWATFPGRNGLIAVHTDGQMWVVRPDGSGLTPLPVSGQGAFSPDGRRLALTDDYTVAVTDLNGGSRRVVYRTRELSISDPAWAPGGDRIYYEGLDHGFFSIPVSGGKRARSP